MSYNDYKSARDGAWEMLIACGVTELPVRVSQICEHYGWILRSYQGGAGSIELLGLSGLTAKTDGFCAVTKNHVYIFYDGSMPAGRQRFTVAHEIGHLMLGHVGPGMATTKNREPTGTEKPEEQQANQFAARLLAPACVLHELGAVTPEAIAQVCGISKQSAKFRAARMRELEHRDRFYAHPLERELIRQFTSYIAAVRRG